MKSNTVLTLLALSASASAFASADLSHAEHDMQNTRYRDHAAVVAHCGVGNYTFRDQPTCAAEVAVTPAKDEVTTAQSSTLVNTAPISTTVYFETASSTLTPASAAKVAQLVKDLKAKGFASVEIETLGFADSRGTEAFNQKLSEERAAATAKAVSAKVKTAKIATEGRGEGYPATTDSTSWENRRVEILVRAVE